MSGPASPSVPALTSELLLRHWLGHRRLTRRTIVAFPEPALFEHHAPGMRSFGAIVHELNAFLPPVLVGAADGVWAWPDAYASSAPTSKAELLAAFDAATDDLARDLPRISAERFVAVDQPIGSRQEPVVFTLLYFLDNEIHHRAQGFVYLRELGIEPPAFYQR
jgi:uncharacterized damage-inducible protein DinB